jgi:N-acetylated-alpha-linked acidic dipeptidase
MPSRIPSIAALAAASLLTVPFLAARTRPAPAVTGFAPAQAGVELSWEKKFLQLPQNDEMRLSEQTLTARPHMAGTPADYATAQYVAAEFKKAGLETEIVPYAALLPYPQEVKVEIVAPGHVLLPNYGTPIPGDPSSYRRDAAVGFNAYSPSGDVTAPVVYANYGLEEDYAELARALVSRHQVGSGGQGRSGRRADLLRPE